LTKRHTITVPLELKALFLKDPENFIRDVACISTESTRPFFKRHDKIIEAFEKGFKNPFNDQTLEFDEDFRSCVDDVHRRFMHVDLGLTKDAVGISMCHSPGFEDREEIEFDDKKMIGHSVRVPSVKFDFLGRIKSVRGEEILLSRIRELIYEISRRGFYLALITFDGFQCLVGDTKIALLDGRDVPIRDLVDEFGRDKEFWVYAFDGEKIVPAKAKNVRKTGRKARTLKIHLDNGEIIQCTPNHPFMLRNGEYVPARSLSPGQSLMPFLTKQLKASKASKLRRHKKIYQPQKESWEYIHQMVKGKAPPGYNVHHVDRNPFNNTPENLQMLTVEEHLEVHKGSPSFGFLSYWAAVQSDSELRRLAREKKSRAMRTRWRGSERKKLLAMNKRAVESARSPEACEKRSKSMMGNTNGRFNKGKNHSLSTRESIAEIVRKKWEDPEYRAKRVGVDRQSGIRGKKWRFDEEQGKRVYYNHKVVKIEEGPLQDVYDIEVPVYHNFALSAGIFVHNSIDSIQILRSQGYKIARLSIDRTATKVILDKRAPDGSGLLRHSTEGQILGPMQALKDVLYDDRLLLPRHEHWKIEARGAEIDYKKNKVDHKPRGSIDLLQSMAGGVYNLINNEFEYMEDDEAQAQVQDDFYERVDFDDDEYYEPQENEQTERPDPW